MSDKLRMATATLRPRTDADAVLAQFRARYRQLNRLPDASQNVSAGRRRTTYLQLEAECRALAEQYKALTA